MAYDIHPCAWPEERLLAACHEERWHGGGVGGQHANKTSSGLRLTWQAEPSIRAQADEERDRLVNRRRAVRRLRLQLATHQRGGSDLAWLDSHRQGAGFKVSAQAKDLAQVSCVLLDALETAAGALAEAAASCSLSNSCFVRSLAIDKLVWQAAQTIRRSHELSELRRPK